MKKIIAIVLAVVMIAAMSVTVFAAEEGTGTKKIDDVNNSGTTVVTYGVDEGFEVVIPGDFNLTVDGAGVGTSYNKEVQVTKLQIFEGNALYVTVSGANATTAAAEEAADYNYALVDTGKTSEVYYNIFLNDAAGSDANATNKADGSKLAGTDAQLFKLVSVKTFEPVTKYLDFLTEATIQAGTFTDTLTFTAEVKAA